MISRSPGHGAGHSGGGAAGDENATRDRFGPEQEPSMPTTTTTGRLRIGDQWNAINIIAHSQTHPLKAICELAENAIDAGATHVRIHRRRMKGAIHLEVHDDGRGVAPDADGVPDFQRIATHLCDSMKRHLDARSRKGIHGEFGIGLLSFWSLGDELRMASGGGSGPLHELQLTRGRQEYTIRPVRGRLAMGGTRVSIGPLLESTKNLVTGDKIARYLSAELRDRIRHTGVTIEVTDGVARRTILVKPREFDGERLDVPRRYATPLGDVQVEIYARTERSPADGGIALCKDGTRVLKDVAELLAFQAPPWTDGRLEGLIDFEPLMLAPGTRSGIVGRSAATSSPRSNHVSMPRRNGPAARSSSRCRRRSPRRWLNCRRRSICSSTFPRTSRRPSRAAASARRWRRPTTSPAPPAGRWPGSSSRCSRWSPARCMRCGSPRAGFGGRPAASAGSRARPSTPRARRCPRG